ncbi:hypothetical protein DM860_010115 [Cuscuta australis]|uniref:Uncharacterized protein n=1 Tax=Cuscuta australis TaxID=267555 RepID=A0A328DAH6_9ASTE|nr:hypothetical protein DM860_010115 [Cuscuta australis]
MEGGKVVRLQLHALLASENIHAGKREWLRNVNLLRQEKNKVNIKLDTVNKAQFVLKRAGCEERWEISLLEAQNMNLSQEKTVPLEELSLVDPKVEDEMREYR